MLTYLVRRVAQIVPTLFVASVLIFGLQQLLPGDPAMVLAGEERDPAVIAHLRETMHLDKPLPVQYVYWLKGVLHGNLTLRGVTRPVALDFTANRRGTTIYGMHATAGFSATAMLQRDDFGIGEFAAHPLPERLILA